MKNLSGYLTARLAERGENYENRLIEEINRNIKPPRPVEPGDVYIRAMYIVSDQINSQGGRFAEEELDRLTGLLVDSPVMVGHQRDSLPLARNFLAQKVDIDGRTWVKSYFYWMKDSEAAEDLKNNIDGGIYKECSVSFLFTLPECSICGKDIRECHHVPFHEYEIESGGREIAHFKYRNIEKVLETSLVFRGAVPDTRITDKLTPDNTPSGNIAGPMVATHFYKVDNTPPGDPEYYRYGLAPVRIMPSTAFKPEHSIVSLYLSPYQPGLDIRISKNDGNIEIDSSRPLADKIKKHLAEHIGNIECESFTVDALLYAVKGKRRINGLGLMQVIENAENLHRLRIKICDLINLNGENLQGDTYQKRLDRMSEIFTGSESRNIEAKRSRHFRADNWKVQTGIEDCSRHNFGIEVLAENGEGMLTRNILTEGRMTMAVIDKIQIGNRGQLFCDLISFDAAAGLPGIICPPLPGLEPGTIAIITGKPGATGKRRPAGSLYDILPGLKSERICAVPKMTPDEGLYMQVIRNGDRLRLCFPESDRQRSVILHHYSIRLFEKGRRFIADLLPEEGDQRTLPKGELIPLKAVTRSGNLILIRLKEISPVFGDKSELWLRPVLIDGRERYLFYGGGINCLPAEL